MPVRRTRPLRSIAIGLCVFGFTGCSLLVDTSGLTGGASTATSDGGGADGSSNGDAKTADGASNDGSTASTILLAAGGNSTCARVRGRLFCWGANADGQLGDGTKEERGAPVAVIGLSGDISAIAVGETHACAVVAGDVWCWGDGSEGELGDGNKLETPTPVKVTGLASGQATSVSAGSRFSCAIVAGSTYCWGLNNRGQVGGEVGDIAPTPVKVAFADPSGPGTMAEVSCGQDHACARATSGDIHCWGHNDNGTLGSPGLATNASIYKGAKVQGLPGPAERLSFAGWHACVTIGGGVWCWGTGDSGELGNGAGTSSIQPVAAKGLESGVTALWVGGGADDGDATCAVQSGAVFCWGHGQRGRLGMANGIRKIPTAVPSITANATAITAGYLHACAVVGEAIRCWGAGDSGQLGNDLGQDSTSPVDVKLSVQ